MAHIERHKPKFIGAWSLQMRAFRFVRFLMGLSLATAIFAQAQAPKPDPHLKQLSALAGRWTYEGEYKSGPLGPGGKITGEYTGRTILNGFFYEGRETEKGRRTTLRSTPTTPQTRTSSVTSTRMMAADSRAPLPSTGTLSPGKENSSLRGSNRTAQCGREYFALVSRQAGQDDFDSSRTAPLGAGICHVTFTGW
jgi:hypothetical protein